MQCHFNWHLCLKPFNPYQCQAEWICMTNKWAIIARNNLMSNHLEPPRGRAILNMVSRHFDLDRNRGALLTAQRVFQIFLQGYSIKELQDFSSLTMRTLNSIPSEDWANKKMLGEWLFHQLRNVRKLERTIDQIKCADPLSYERDFNFLWERLQQLLVEECEDLNVRSIEQASKSPKRTRDPSNKTPAVPAKAAPAGPVISAAVSNPSPPPEKANANAPPAGKAKTSAKNLMPKQKAKTPCIFFQMPSGCIHGDKYVYSHVKSPPPAKAKNKNDPKAKLKPKPQVAAAVAIVAALSSMVTPSQAFGSLEWAADSGAGRHLASFEALREQGYHESAFEQRFFWDADPHPLKVPKRGGDPKNVTFNYFFWPPRLNRLSWPPPQTKCNMYLPPTCYIWLPPPSPIRWNHIKSYVRGGAPPISRCYITPKNCNIDLGGICYIFGCAYTCLYVPCFSSYVCPWFFLVYAFSFSFKIYHFFSLLQNWVHRQCQ